MRYIVGVLAAASLLAGCAVAGKPTAAPVTDEWRQAVFEAVSGLGAQMGPIGAAMVTGDHMTNYTAMHTACTDMRNYVDGMQHKVLPGPDVQINEALQGGIDGFRSMADQCVALTPANSSSRLNKLAATMAEADKHIKDAIKMLNAAVPKR
ncbi:MULTISPECIES: hypothetical protein [unclassified Mycolicibacterium]|uniref:hypothetical protein n=1 Tax=unclassified Mycolicibacterium TaxID=2636767 RepID=UPI0012DDDC67|nr:MULTISPECIES: hypothetical protein [unclassified Mycolicibacterium]MUL81582.1 hypothetical protein [Mycolicibacterium sp. CBMA 329]MUL87348.1 hypothetical protein [Mycolicibacterium sp. CBMA 331]MUM02635.1 hypothetical protein [Mycolicibacterium sp. CBMA 334]MUM28477.1 hypothetical protein [Mycolicibacterium sp. CBMA 295]MUM37645.1 hypothetical protein [Mycolicibacterium sp. CBMA 247]